ncbi:MAG TPA: glucans biosynthesis glucosyltransferase MdoH [Acetobacteraceae bacterium]|nr:glucans biosynthesis glucosyltransferase MdoH [Acetobacteraceae bacterium]
MDGVADVLAHPATPPEAPLPMPAQPLHARARRTRLPSAPGSTAIRRLVVIGGAVALTGAAGYAMYRVLDVGGLTPLEIALLVLFVVLFAWIALAFTSALCGFAAMLAGGGLRLGVGAAGPLPELAGRTALLMPCYNESPARIFAGLQAIDESLAAAGRIGHFDLFLLSDTTNPEVWITEEAAFLALRERTGGHRRIFYRRRAENTERKAGNIADWVRRWGGAYAQFLILDADSVMTADAIVRLAAALEAHGDVGLIQTLPIIVNASTLFARMQQFAGRVYGPVIAHGIAWWHGAEGNYWGHNAIIRTRAFAEQAGLPTLKGRKPFGGPILSHDFIEAALMRRGGWAIHMVPGLPGSYEEAPPSLTALAIRDRRWCQGNLQHAAVLPARGLHPISRLHLLMGIGSYITAPLWLLYLLVGILIALQARFVRPEYFSADPSLFPRWPRMNPVLAMWVFVGTMAVLLVPKLLGWFALMCDARARRGCGGAVRSLLGVLLETVIGGLLAPVAMMIQAAGVAAILFGQDSGWNTQRRDDGRVPVREIARAYTWHTVFGLVLAGIAFVVDPHLVAWMSPVVLGLALAIPLAAGTASVAAGRALARMGLLRTPEEAAPPDVLRRAMTLQREIASETAADIDAISRLFSDRDLLQAHRAMLEAAKPRSPALDQMLAVTLAKLDEQGEPGLRSLTPQEKTAVLGSRRGLDLLERCLDAYP